MRLVFAFICFLFITSCEKEQEGSERCRDLQAAFISTDEAKIKEVVTTAISSLPSKAHTQQNLQALASALSNKCGLTAKVLCYSCIYTLPEQSEIRISIPDGINIVNKTIDISSTSISNKTMKFVGMHD